MTQSTPQQRDTGGPVRVLVIDKTAVLESVRDRWDRFAKRSNIDLTVLVPNVWIENYERLSFKARPGLHYRVIVGKVIWPGKEQRSIYTRGLIRALRASKPDVILMMEESFSLFAAQVLLLKPFFASSSHWIFYSNNITSYDRYLYRPSWFWRVVGRIVTPRTEVGLCVNAKAVEVLKNAGFDVDIRQLFYGVDETLFRTERKEELRKKLSLSPNEKLFLYAGQLRTLKGVQDLVEAFSRLLDERPGDELRLLIIGSGEHEEALRQQVAELNVEENVDFYGMMPLESMPAYIGAADVFTLPSRKEIYEQLGRVNVEAMLSGTTIVGSTSGGIPEVIGDGGYVFDAGNVDELTQTFRDILDNPEEAQRRRVIGRERALNFYSSQSFIDGLIHLIEELTGKSITH